jgi:hypothetical protein
VSDLEPQLTEPWTPEEEPQSLLRRAYRSDLFGWVRLALDVLFVLAVVFGVVLVILYFTENPGNEGMPLPL